MDKFEKQRRIFSINAVLLLVSYIGLVVAIPAILQDIYPGSNPKQAAIATTVSACLHLLVFIGFLIGIRQAKRRRRMNREINIAAAIVTGIFGLVMLDGAIGSLGHALLTSIGFFTCASCDLASVIVSIAALFIVSSKKTSQPG